MRFVLERVREERRRIIRTIHVFKGLLNRRAPIILSLVALIHNTVTFSGGV